MALYDEDEDTLRIPGATDEDYDAPEQTETSLRRPPRFPTLGTNPESNLNQIARYGQAVEQFDISQRITQKRRQELENRRAHNAAARKTQAETGAQFITDEAGYEQPVIDPDTGRQRYTTRESEVRFDEKGRPFQVKTGKAGERTIEDPDKDAQYGENPDDPNDPFIYRKTKATPWQPIDPEEGIRSPIPKLAAVSARILHKRELEKLTSEQADINLRLREPTRPRQLTEQKRADLVTLREGLSQPIPKPAPKPAMFGMGVNQQATANAAAQWMTEEQERTVRLSEVEKSLALDDERMELEKQAYELALKHKATKDTGPAGLLKQRREAAAQKLAALPEDEAKREIESRAKNIEIGDQAIVARGQDLKARSEALDAETSMGVTAERAREIEADRAGILRDADQINTEIASRNALADETKAGIDEINRRQRETIKAKRDELRKTPEFAPIADQLDTLDADAEARVAAAQGIAEPTARQAAIDEIQRDVDSKAARISADYEIAASGGFPRSAEPAQWDEADKAAWAKLAPEKKREFLQRSNQQKITDEVTSQRTALASEEFEQPADWDTLTPEEKKKQLSDFQRNKATYIRAFDTATRQKGPDYAAVIDELTGIAPGGFKKQVTEQLSGRTKAAISAAGAAYAGVGTSLLDLGTATQSVLGKRPDDTWTRQMSEAIHDFYETGIEGEHSDAAATNLVSVLASAHSFLAPGGIIGKALGGTKKAMTAAAAISGAVINGGQAYSDALDMGMTGPQAFARLAIGVGLGTTEAVGVGSILAKLDKLSKGGIGRFFTNLLKQGVEEGAQEAFQSGAQDLADLVILGKDDKRVKALTKIRDDAIENGLWGAAAGILFTGLVDAANRRDRRALGLPEDEIQPLAKPTPGIQPEHVAAANVQIDAWQPPAQLSPEGAQLERMAARGAIKVIAGQPMESLLAEERSALESKLPNGAPRMEEVEGTTIITQGQINRLKMIAPDTAGMPIRDEATLREELISKGEETKEGEKKGEPEAPPAFKGEQAKPAPAKPAPAEGAAPGAVSPGAGPPVARGIIRPLSNPETLRAKALSAVLKSTGADEKVAAAFARHFVMQEGAATEFTGQRERIKQAFAAAGGKENAPAIMTALATQGKIQRKTVEETFTEAVRQIEQGGRSLSEREKKALRVALPHLAPAIDRWREAFARVTFARGGMGSGGVVTTGKGALDIPLDDLLDVDNLETIARDPARAELLVNEEARHVVARAVLAEIGKQRGLKGESDDKIADAYAAEVWEQLPPELQKAVTKIYTETGKIQGAFHAGHEFFRMLSQHDTSIQAGKLLYKGKVLTEQTLGAKVVGEIRNYLKRLFSYFTDLAKSLKDEGAPDDIVQQVEAARSAIRDRIKELQTAVVERQEAKYKEEYAEQEARGHDRGRKAGAKGEAGGPEAVGPGVANVPRGEGEAVEVRPTAGPARGGARETQVGAVRPVPGERAAPEAAQTSEQLRIAELEAEKSEREAAEERAKERRNLAVQKRAERMAGKDAILVKVPEDAKQKAAFVLEKMDMGSPTYVLAANRERLPASYVAVAPDTVQTSHVGADFHKNPLYGGENVRPYHSDETEQNKVRRMAQPGALDEDAAVSDVKSAAEGSPQIVLAIFNDSAGNLQVQAQTAGGNGREQGVNLSPLEDQERLSEAWRAQGANFGLAAIPEGWRGYRFVGVYDLRDEAQNREYLQLVDKLNPSPGVVQDTAARADIDAALKIPVEAISHIPLSLSPSQAVTELTALIRDAEKLGLDRNLMSGLVNNPGQAQFYIQRLLLAAAFRSKAIGDFFTSAQWASGHATVSGLIKSATTTALKLREKGQGNIADAIGRTIERVAEYIQKGDNIAKAIKRAADQTEMGDDGPVINAIADALVRKVEFQPLNKRGLRPVDSEETIAGFESFMRDMATAVGNFSEEPDLLGEQDTIAATIARAIAAHERKSGLASAPAKAEPTVLSNVIEIRAIDRKTKGVTPIKVPATKELVRALSVHETIYKELIKCLDS